MDDFIFLKSRKIKKQNPQNYLFFQLKKQEKCSKQDTNSFKQETNSFKQDTNSFKQDTNSFKQDTNSFKKLLINTHSWL